MLLVLHRLALIHSYMEIKSVIDYYFFAAPTPPRDFACRQSNDSYIILAWEDPEYPNGDLVQYHIEVYLKSNNSKIKINQTKESVREFKIEDLEPGMLSSSFLQISHDMYYSLDITV